MSSKASSWLQELQRLSITHALPEDVTQNVAANSSNPAYNVTSYADLQNSLELTCSMYSNSSYVSAVQRCSGLRNGKCCVSYDSLAPTVVSHFTTRYAFDCIQCTQQCLPIIRYHDVCTNLPSTEECNKLLLTTLSSMKYWTYSVSVDTIPSG